MKHGWFLPVTLLIIFASYPLLAHATTWFGGDLSVDPHDQSGPRIAVSGKTVHVVWEDDRSVAGNGRDIVYIRSTDGGESWKDPVKVADNVGDQQDPDVAVYGDQVYIVWEDKRNYATTGSDIYIRRSEDGGATWQAEQQLTSEAANQWDPKVAATSDYVHVTWLDERNMATANYDVYYRRSSTSGRSWEEEQRLTLNSAIQWRQSIAAYGEYVYVAYEDYRDWHYPPGSSKGVITYYARSTDGGLSWSKENKIPTKGAWQFYADVAASDNHVYITYMDGRNFSKSKSDIWLLRSEDCGKTWSNETMIISDPNMQESPKIAATDQQVHIVWQDYRNMNTAGMDIYYMQGNQYGTDWEEPVRLTQDQWQYQPTIAASGERVHIVWTDEQLLATNGQDVFYITR